MRTPDILSDRAMSMPRCDREDSWLRRTTTKGMPEKYQDRNIFNGCFAAPLKWINILPIRKKVRGGRYVKAYASRRGPEVQKPSGCLKVSLSDSQKGEERAAGKEDFIKNKA